MAGIVAVALTAGVLLTTGNAEAQVVQQPVWRLLGGNVSTILNAWKVGIGTTTPWGKLSITGTAGQTNPLFQIASSTETPVFTVASDGTATFAGNVTISGTCTGCGAAVAGSDTQVIFNDGGSAYGGDAGLTFNKTNDSLSVVGTSTASTTVTGYGQTSIFETGVTYYAKAAIRSDDPNVGAALIFERNATTCPLGGCGIWAYRSRGDRTTKTVVQADDSIGSLYYGGYDGTDYEPAASIGFLVDGTPGDNHMPGRIVFSTTADGANTLTERLRISASGVSTFAGNVALGANSLTMTGSLGAPGARLTKGWFTDLESTNMPTVGGTSLSSTFAPLASPTFTGTLTAGDMRVGTTSFASASSTPKRDVVYKSAAAVECSLTDGATVTFDLRECNAARVTLGGNRTIDFTNQNEATGQGIRFMVCQDGTGTRTLTWDSAVRWVGGTAPTLTTTANKCDLIAGFTTAATGTPIIVLDKGLNI
jgi:hypothetical protein